MTSIAKWSSVALFLFLFLLVLPVNWSFPLRDLESTKNRTRNLDQQQPLLCWVVQIRTSCAPQATKFWGDATNSGGEDEHVARDENDVKVCSACKYGDVCTKTWYQHASALATEMRLVVIHSFKHFPDHFLMCHSLSTEMLAACKTEEIPTFVENIENSPHSPSRSLHLIQQQHSRMRLKDAQSFHVTRSGVEQQLMEHEEVVWFSGESAHLRVSRPGGAVTVAPPTFHSANRGDDDLFVHNKDRFSLNEEPVVDGLSSVNNTTVLKFLTPNRFLRKMPQSTYAARKSKHKWKSFKDFETFEPESSEVVNDGSKFPPAINATSSAITSDPWRSERGDDSHNLPLRAHKKQEWKDRLVKEMRIVGRGKEIRIVGRGLETRNAGRGKEMMMSEALTDQKSGHERVKRSSGRPLSFNDPAYPQQWHLHNIRQPGMDINVTGVWDHGFTGRGVTVAVVDDGIEWRNPDLKQNYNYKASWDLNDDDPDPTPRSAKVSNHHGTRCAGEIAAVANNNVCAVGVAYESGISGVRVLDGVLTDSMEAQAFNTKMDINDIYSCSWGPDDDGRTVDGPHIMAAKAMKHGIDFGRNGYGSIFVVASGNGGVNKDNCNFDGYANSIYTVTIGAVDEEGGMPYYAEECASMLGVTFSSGTVSKRDIVTTDWTQVGGHGCTSRHTGTSAAAPLAAAMIALMLQARPCLSWRDVQYIMILTAYKIDVDIAHWQKNGAGLEHSHKHGFGLLSAWRLVNAARVWESVPWATSYAHTETPQRLDIPKGASNPLRISHVVSESDIRGLSMFTLENAQLTVWLSHPCRGKLGVKLISPSGTVSVLATPRPKDNSSAGFDDWTFTTVRCWGEKPTGTWTIVFIDHDNGKYGGGWLVKWRLILFGTPLTPEEFAERRRRIETAMSGDFLNANHSRPCPPAPHVAEKYSPVSQRTLKILILLGSFCLVIGVYETIEYLLCYNEEKKEHAKKMGLTQRALQSVDTSNSHRNGDAGGDRTPLVGGNAETSTDVEADWRMAVGDDDDGDDEIFNASETSQLLRAEPSSRGGSGGGGHHHRRVPEVIPLATFSLTSGEANHSELVVHPSPRSPLLLSSSDGVDAPGSGQAARPVMDVVATTNDLLSDRRG
ncbi:proprotein convertase subtilisin/kexin type 7 [Aplysia californica]|uniref:Proprotein convertase subtilisin/kexin type 7 n=1 Tax=Aplysia californica TaxID=6500 RepID=A0ABM0JPC2_APLCA|nr:proprotein convertase subtilisin/kexin type 7 [Aplysia californica]